MLINNDEQQFIKFKALFRPVLFSPSRVDKLKRELGLELLADMKLFYDSLEYKEDCYQKLRNDYPLRTLELLVGDMQAIDFAKATKFSRVRDSLGFLDTTHYLIKEAVEADWDSPKSFALSRAVEYQNGTLSSDDLF